MENINLKIVVPVIIAIAGFAVHYGITFGNVKTLQEVNHQMMINNTVNPVIERLTSLEEVLDSTVEATTANLKSEIAKRTIPPSSIVAWAGKKNKVPSGWDLCGDNNTPSLDGFFLLGTLSENKVGTKVGSETHRHDVDIKTGFEANGTKKGPEGADNYTGGPNWNHKHVARGRTKNVNNLPPAMKVFFLCKK